MDSADFQRELEARLAPRHDLRDWGAWTELLVGPGGTAVFAIHRINDSRRENDRRMITDHEFRYVPSYESGFGNFWDLDFPDGCPHWRGEFDRWRRREIQGADWPTPLGDVDHYLLMHFADGYAIVDEYVPRVVQLFDALVEIPRELARLLALQPDTMVNVDVLPEDLRLFVEWMIDTDLPVPAREVLAVLDPLRTWRDDGDHESLRWLAHALMSVLFATGPYVEVPGEHLSL